MTTHQQMLYQYYRGQLPTESEARKGIPVYSGFVAYFPDAMAEVARLSKAGNDKHNPGEPLHWSREKSADHADCLMRHLLEAGTIDDDGFSHTVKVAWRAMALLQEELEARTTPSTETLFAGTVHHQHPTDIGDI